MLPPRTRAATAHMRSRPAKVVGTAEMARRGVAALSGLKLNPPVLLPSPAIGSFGAPLPSPDPPARADASTPPPREPEITTLTRGLTSGRCLRSPDYVMSMVA